MTDTHEPASTATSDLWRLDATAIAELVRSGERSAVEVVDAAIDRAERLDQRVNSIVHPRFDAARAEAAALDATSPDRRGPLAGVPFALKDWKCTVEGEPSTWAMAGLASVARTARATTELARRYQAAGLVSIGRTNLPELAFGPPTTESTLHGPCRNPWALDRSVGGSSGGSAAIVAAGIVPVANASDGGGSLRIPAAACGLVGLKVTRGRITNAPHADGRGAKVEGHIARSVRDVALVLDVSAGSLPGEPFALPAPERAWADAIDKPPPPLRIGMLERAPGAMDRNGGDPGVLNRAAVAVAADLLASLGHEVVEGHPTHLDEPLQTPNLYAAERAALRWLLEADLGRPLTPDDVEPRTWAMFELAGASAGPVVIEELGNEQRWARDVSAWWRPDPQLDGDAGFDLLLTPVLGRDVPTIGELKESADDPLGTMVAGFPLAWFTYPFNVTGHPAIAVPISPPIDGERPPVGVQLVTAHGREDLLLQVAATLEQQIGWPQWWPSLASGAPS